MKSKRYTVHITKAVEEDLKEFDSYRSKVINKIRVLGNNPKARHALKGKLKGLRSLDFLCRRSLQGNL